MEERDLVKEPREGLGVGSVPECVRQTGALGGGFELLDCLVAHPVTNGIYKTMPRYA